MENNDTGALEITLFSFGFKHGVPVDASFLLDVRFLPNPYWVEDLRHLSGKEQEIASFVVGSEAGGQFFDLLQPLLSFIARQLQAGGKRELRVGIGCTGGRHRSVAVVEALGVVLARQSSLEVTRFHRDIDKISN